MADGIGGMLGSSRIPSSVAGLDDERESARLTSVTGGGLHRSYSGSPEALKSCLVFIGAMIAVVTIAEWASKTSTGLLSLSVSDGPVDQI